MNNLTTGQMLDKLGMKDTATNQDGYKVGYSHKGDLLMWGKGDEMPEINDGNKFIIYYPWMGKDSWDINYRFVDFEEAQTAHVKEKKTIIYYHNEDTQYEFVYGKYGHFEQLASDGIELEELSKGKWIIVH